MAITSLAPAMIVTSDDNCKDMSWENLCYSVDINKGRKKTTKQLLNNVSGFVRPGMLMALMGPSGAGKVWKEEGNGERGERDLNR